MYFVNFLTVLLGNDGLPMIEKVVTGHRTTELLPQHSDQNNFSLEKCRGVSSWSNHYIERLRLSQTIHFLWQVTTRSRNKFVAEKSEEDISKRWFLWFSFNLWGIHLSSLLFFLRLRLYADLPSINFSICHYQWLTDDHDLRHILGYYHTISRNFLNYRCIVRSLTVLG